MSIVAQDKIFNGLSGKYNFHSMKNNKPAFIREGGKVPGLVDKNHYLAWSHEFWFFQQEAWFLEGESGGYLCIRTPGKYFFCSDNNSKIDWIFIGNSIAAILTLCILEINLLALDSCWEEFCSDDESWSHKATIKIFSDEKQFNEYQKTLKK